MAGSLTLPFLKPGQFLMPVQAVHPSRQFQFLTEEQDVNILVITNILMGVLIFKLPKRARYKMRLQQSL